MIQGLEDAAMHLVRAIGKIEIEQRELAPPSLRPALR
jgi:hypothetical protein